ncbi:MAG TPA: alpha/beta fold hydrolase [Ktedonobacterales bacterium]
MAKVTTQLARGIGFTAAGALAAVAGGIAYSALAVDHAATLPPALDAERRTLTSAEAGTLSYYADEWITGRPLVFVHGIDAAASAYEMRPLFGFYRTQRPVYALDLPGFGFSERADRVYTPALYTQAVLDFLRHVGLGAGGADVMALSLSSEFAARAALAQPSLMRSLTLISPSGFTDRTNRSQSERDSERQGGRLLHQLLANPLWSQAFYDLLTSRPSIRAFLRMRFVGQPDAGLVAYGYATAHQPGARYAPLYFLSGQLFTPNIRETVYERLTIPALALFDHDAFVRFDTLHEVTRRCANWHAVRIVPSRGLPQFERLADTTNVLETFWRIMEEDRSSSTTA